ncbi:MAG: 30S ribosomal protein S6 [bacterium]|nr:30S ribosomal protein S6 [bacterium]
MRDYEIMILFDPATNEKDINNFLNQIDGNKKVEDLGVKKLAYRIKKKDTAHYFVLRLLSDNINAIKSMMDKNSNILRYLIIRK